MSLTDPSAERAFIWLIALALFLCVAAGGACLAMYMLLPASDTTSWLPVVGVTLVCLPWLFWFVTFLYRILSRVCGFRFSCCGIGGGGGGGRVATFAGAKGGGSVGSMAGGGGGASMNATATNKEANDKVVEFPAAECLKGSHGGVELLVDDHVCQDGQPGGKIGKRSSSASSGSSSASNESEMPLAISMRP